MRNVNIFKTMCIVIILLFMGMSCAVYAEGKAKGHDNENKGGNSESAPGHSRSESSGGGGSDSASSRSEAAARAQESRAAQAAERSTERSERARVQADAKANRHDRSIEANSRANEGKEKIDRMAKAFENAKWWYNPKDTRGQGNMGKPTMLAPFGFDKDSDRKELYGNNGRPIKGFVDPGPVPDPDINYSSYYFADFTFTRYDITYYSKLLAEYTAAGNTELAAMYQNVVNYLSSLPYMYLGDIKFNLDGSSTYATAGYSLYIGKLPNTTGATLDITTSLISVNSYDSDSPTGVIHYDAGQVLYQQTDQFVAGTIDNVNYSYDLSYPTQDNEMKVYGFNYSAPIEMAGYEPLDTQLVITVTEQETGKTSTINYDTYFRYYQLDPNRCPYGKVFNAKNKLPVVGAKITVFNEDGSIVALDKASNPTAGNPQITDATGRYGCKLEINKKYYIVAKAEGYKEYKSPIFTEKWHVLREDIPMALIKDESAPAALNTKNIPAAAPIGVVAYTSK